MYALLQEQGKALQKGAHGSDTALGINAAATSQRSDRPPGNPSQAETDCTLISLHICFALSEAAISDDRAGRP